MGNAIAIQTLTLQNEGWERDRASPLPASSIHWREAVVAPRQRVSSRAWTGTHSRLIYFSSSPAITAFATASVPSRPPNSHGLSPAA